jgi:hypothetical protein
MLRLWLSAALLLAACDGKVGDVLDAGGGLPDGTIGLTDGGVLLPDGGVILPDGGSCLGTTALYRDVAWPAVFSRCVVCHVTGGAADGTRFQLRPLASQSALAQNIAATTSALSLESNGQQLLLLKPTGQLPHGGGTVFASDSAQAATLRRVIAELPNPIVCPGDEVRPITEGLVLLDDVDTLIKASLQLVGRPPTAAEVAEVQANGLAGLETALTQQMRTSAFEERVREMFGDVLLTDGFRANNTDTNSGNIINSVYHSRSVRLFGGMDYDWRSWPRGEGIRLVEALAREPVEFFVQAVKNDRPLSDVVTARHRLLNAYSARYYGVRYRGFDAGTAFSAITEPERYEVAASVPVNEAMGTAEYAGVLTTPAWLLRYPSSPTNFNRKRSRFTMKYFMDFDIMKAAPRIDAAAVDLEDTPTVKNMQCVSCHALLDPLAGMYLNQDECGYEDAVFYMPPGAPKNNACPNRGWTRPMDMFQPGVGAGTPNALMDADRPRALEVLGAHVAAQRGFAKSMVTHVATSLWGRPLLVPPTDTSLPEYAALDAAAAFEARELERLTDRFVAGGLRLPPLVLEIVKGQTFRAGNADALGRLELTGLGGGTLVTPEVLDRKLRSTLGLTWSAHGWAVSGDTGYQRLGRHDGTHDAYLLQRERLKTLYGGMDGSQLGVKTRSRFASSLTAAVIEHLALEASCIAVTRDFDAPTAQRALFPLVEKTFVPTGMAGPDANVLETIRALHLQLLGARVTTGSADVQELYTLLRDVQRTGVAAIAAGTERAALERPCASDLELSTGQPRTGTTRDDAYVIRAWQAVIATLLLDPRFTLEK